MSAVPLIATELVTRGSPSLGAKSRHMQCSKKHPYSINSLARSRNVSGIATPSALAVVRLIMRSNLVGCSTGICRFRAPQNLVDIIGRAPPLVQPVWSIRYEAARFDVLTKAVHRRQPSAERQSVDAKAIGK